MQVRQLLLSAAEQLAQLSDSPQLDAEVLLAHSLNKNRTWLVTWPDKDLNSDQLDAFDALLLRRKNGEPIAHITGTREFWSLPLNVTPETLIPRPDTELLVEQVLLAFPADKPVTLVDLGTGSGAIALAIASERPEWRIIATDQSIGALEVAKKNAEQLNIRNVEFRQGSWFEPLNNVIADIIVSNPPYIPRQDPHLSSGDVRFEPMSALASGEDGLDDIRLLISQSRKHLKTGGMLFIEHGYDQKQGVFHLFKDNGLKEILQHHDLANNPRITCGINI